MVTTKEENDKKRSRTINVKAEKSLQLLSSGKRVLKSSLVHLVQLSSIGSFIVKIKMKEGRKRGTKR
jgi:hypothetical protein